MSTETRIALANSPRLIYQRASQKSDLIDYTKTRTQLVAAIAHLVANGWYLTITALVSDHHDDTGICRSGPPYCGTHAHGWAADLWPMDPNRPGRYLDAGDLHFQKFLSQVMAVPFYMQTGLGGTSDTKTNQDSAGPQWFPDSDEDHVHIGTRA
jgi:hypothetical protein